jgi:hypothetical protein
VQDADKGTENMTAADIAIPFLQMLQSGSPQVVKGNPARIAGAEPGFIFETVTGRVFDKLRLIPCAYHRIINEWMPRDEGGGFRGTLPWTAELSQLSRDRDYRTATGTQLVDTAQWFVLYEDDTMGSWRQAVIGMASTQLTTSRRWASLIKGIQRKLPDGTIIPAPMFSHIYEAASVSRHNDQGDWFVWTVQMEGQIKEKSLYLLARGFYDSILRNEVKVGTPEPPADGAPSSGGSRDEEKPF